MFKPNNNPLIYGGYFFILISVTLCVGCVLHSAFYTSEFGPILKHLSKEDPIKNGVGKATLSSYYVFCVFGFLFLATLIVFWLANITEIKIPLIGGLVNYITLGFFAAYLITWFIAYYQLKGFSNDGFGTLATVCLLDYNLTIGTVRDNWNKFNCKKIRESFGTQPLVVYSTLYNTLVEKFTDYSSKVQNEMLNGMFREFFFGAVMVYAGLWFNKYQVSSDAEAAVSTTTEPAEEHPPETQEKKEEEV